MEFFNNLSQNETYKKIMKKPLSYNIGIILGATLATLLASEFKIKKIKGKKQLFGAVLGGFLMGAGARLASGCNIAAFFSALSALSLTGWFYGLSAFAGAFIGSKILLNYIIKE